MDKMNRESLAAENTEPAAKPQPREATTFPPLGPGYYSTRLNAVVENKAVSTDLRIGWYCKPDDKK